VINFDIEQF